MSKHVHRVKKSNIPIYKNHVETIVTNQPINTIEVETNIYPNGMLQNSTNLYNASFENALRTNKEQQLLVKSLKEEVLAKQVLLRYAQEQNRRIQLELDELKQHLASQEELHHLQKQKFNEKEQHLMLENDRMVKALKLQLGKER
jgi:hypothetical protein